MYCRVPDPEIALTRKGHTQAAEAGRLIREQCEREGTPYKLFFYISPYKRTKQTAAGVASAFPPEAVMGVREARPACGSRGAVRSRPRAFCGAGAAASGAGLWEFPGLGDACVPSLRILRRRLLIR